MCARAASSRGRGLSICATPAIRSSSRRCTIARAPTRWCFWTSPRATKGGALWRTLCARPPRCSRSRSWWAAGCAARRTCGGCSAPAPTRWRSTRRPCGGRTPTGMDAVAWSVEAAALGAGELLVTSMDEDGREDGYDLPLLRAVTQAVRIPVIASGGAGTPEHLWAAIVEADADAVLAASIFHYRKYSIAAVKAFLAERGVAVRPVEGQHAASR